MTHDKAELMHTRIEVGGYIKCRLPGETPWARIISVHQDGYVTAEIANRTVPELTPAEQEAAVGGRLPVLHDYRLGDVALFRQEADGGFWCPLEWRSA